MGLHISSINGLKAAAGYELYILTYCLEPGSPEFRAVQQNFSYFADSLGVKGMVITGSYDREFGKNFSGFLEEVETKLFSVSMTARQLSSAEELPVPALVVLKKTQDGEVEVCYLSIRNLSSEQIVAVFRDIASCNQKGGLGDIPNNLLSRRGSVERRLWDAIQIRPSFYGVGLDVKELLKRIK